MFGKSHECLVSDTPVIPQGTGHFISIHMRDILKKLIWKFPVHSDPSGFVFSPPCFSLLSAKFKGRPNHVLLSRRIDGDEV